MAMADYTIDKYSLMNIGPKSCIHKFQSNWYNFTWRLEKPTKPENLFANVKTNGKNVIVSQTVTKLDNLNTRYYLSNGAGFEDEVLKDATRRVIMDRNVSKVSKHAKCAFMFRVHHVAIQNTQMFKPTNPATNKHPTIDCHCNQTKCPRQNTGKNYCVPKFYPKKKRLQTTVCQFFVSFGMQAAELEFVLILHVAFFEEIG